MTGNVVDLHRNGKSEDDEEDCAWHGIIRVIIKSNCVHAGRRSPRNEILSSFAHHSFCLITRRTHPQSQLADWCVLCFLSTFSLGMRQCSSTGPDTQARLRHIVYLRRRPSSFPSEQLSTSGVDGVLCLFILERAR